MLMYQTAVMQGPWSGIAMKGFKPAGQCSDPRLVKESKAVANHHHSIVIYMLYKNIPDTQLEYYNTYILCITDRACISRLGRLPLGVLQNKNKTNLGKFPNMGC